MAIMKVRFYFLIGISLIPNTQNESTTIHHNFHDRYKNES
jgi:hypothetical protein